MQYSGAYEDGDLRSNLLVDRGWRLHIDREARFHGVGCPENEIQAAVAAADTTPAPQAIDATTLR
jgi:hypothetical protein